MRRSGGIGALVLGVVAVLAPGAVPAASATTTVRYVDDDGHANLADGCGGGRTVSSTIQGAIAASDADDEIRVCPGTYPGYLSISSQHEGLIVKAVTWGTATIKPQPDPAAGRARPGGGAPELVRIDTASDVTLRGFRLVAPTAGGCTQVPDMVVVSDGARRALLKNLVIRPGGADTLDGPCGYRTGVRVAPGSSATLDGGLIRDFIDTGVLVTGGGARITVKGTRMEFDHASAPARPDCVGRAVAAQDEGRLTVRGVAVAGSPSAALDTGTPILCNGVTASSAGPVDVRDVTVDDVLLGIFLSSVASPILAGARVFDARSDGIQLYAVTGGEVRDAVVRRSADNAIKLDAAASGVSLHDNDFRTNAGVDCLDESTGTGSKGTANTWVRNRGGQSDPVGICTP